uniref:uncharacterized protein LOC105350692 isoform X1 n=1 Tax=Fragaria vesca subsp. vesca TaxID=101020 RepID=UPI0005C8969F|nr:PREDICTED: uncharacterized protein LOC105350692 isoform X1 [Fragaria vesca subsp. vesca]
MHMATVPIENHVCIFSRYIIGCIGMRLGEFYIWYFVSDLAGLDNQFQTFTEVFESVVSGFERERRSERGDETILGEFRFPKESGNWNLGGLFQGVFGFWLSARHGEKANE